jgi:hypothetical protein
MMGMIALQEENSLMLAKRSLIMLSRQQRQRLPEVLDVTSPGPGLLDEKMLLLVLRAANWNPFLLCTSAQVCKRWADIMKRVVWKEFCLSRAPKMVGHLLSGGRDGSIPGGWEPLGKLMFYCTGCHASTHFISKTIPGHFVWKTRFSKTSGKWFLVPQCQADILYISKICEHLDNGDDDDLVLYRGIFSSFGTSRTRRMLMERGAKLEEDELCPFCHDKVCLILRLHFFHVSSPFFSLIPCHSFPRVILPSSNQALKLHPVSSEIMSSLFFDYHHTVTLLLWLCVIFFTPEK